MNADYGRCNGKASGLKILLIEDSPDNALQSMAILFRSDGHHVEFAADAPAACQVALRAPPDVVLLNLALREMDGWELARRLQKPTWLKKPFVIAVTECGGEEDQRRSLDAGVDLHLVKPVSIDFLCRLLARFCQIIMPTEEVLPTSDRFHEPTQVGRGMSG